MEEAKEHPAGGMMPELTSRAVAAEHRRLALAWHESPPEWLADDGTWSLHCADHWARRYHGLAQGAGGAPIGYAEQIVALRWAYGCRDIWGDGWTWGRLLSGRAGAERFAQKVRLLLDRIEVAAPLAVASTRMQPFGGDGWVAQEIRKRESELMVLAPGPTRESVARELETLRSSGARGYLGPKVGEA